MNFWEFLLFLLAGWTLIGAAGVTISLTRRERSKGLRNFLWILAVWAIYMGMLAWSSRTQPQKIVALGQDQCFDKMCFAVTAAQDVPGEARDGSRLVRVSVRIVNRSKEKTQNDGLIRAYLVDGQGHKWVESAAVSGVRLTARLVAGGSAVSQPVFKVPGDDSGLALVFTHGHGWPGALVIGDSDSLWHRRTVVPLGL